MRETRREKTQHTTHTRNTFTQPPPPPPPHDHTGHLDHLTQRKVQAMELTKKMKRHSSQFWVAWRTTMASVQRDTNNNSGIDTNMSRIERQRSEHK